MQNWKNLSKKQKRKGKKWGNGLKTQRKEK